MAYTLPRFIVLKDDNTQKYLCRIHDSEETGGLLEFSGEEVVNTQSKFEVEPAEGEENVGLVHIKCCYNNKYWVCHENQYWVVPDANEKEEDHSKWSCTLFKPEFDDSNTFNLYHVFHGYNAGWWESWDTNGHHKYCLYAGPNVNNDLFRYIDWESLSMLPERIAFKGSNGYYLSACTTEGRYYLEFNCNQIDDVTVGNQVFTNNEGSIRIKSDKTGKFWRLSPNWIWPDSDDTTDRNLDTCFWANMVNSNTISLFNCGGRKYCKGLTTEGKTNCLNACADDDTSVDTHMQIEEFVRKREIYNVRYQLSDTRTYDHNVITMVTISSKNSTTVSQNTTLELTYTKEETETWNSSVSVKLGIETKITAGVPTFAEAGVTVSAEVETNIGWGVTTTTSEEIKTIYATEVPPKTMVTVSVTAIKVSYDLPYSYTQRDTLINGEVVTYEMDDGIYTGSNAYKFESNTTESAITNT